MARFTNPLKHVRVAAPCPADWERMTGVERVRFCAQCRLHVYNLSAMTRREAERLITTSEDRLCIRFYRRADGTILTKNCPLGLRALKRRISKIAGAIFAAVTSFWAVMGYDLSAKQSESLESPAPSAAEEYPVVMGAMGSPLDDNPYPAGTLLGGAIFLFGYPLLKFKERREAKQRESLHIWRRP